MKKFYVYIHTCPNGKKYVGITTASKPERRWREGKGYWYNKHFYSTILKYGWDNITHEVFEVESEEEMYRKEVELISFYHSNDPEYGYNNSTGGEKGALGCTRSEEFRKRVSESVKERCSDPEYRKKLSEGLKGKPHKPFSEEARKHMVEAAKKRASDPEYRKKQSKAHKGRTLSEETKQRMSEAHKGKPFSEEHKRKMSEARKKEWLDPEFRRKMSEAQKKVQKKVHADPEYRKKKSEVHKKRWSDPGFREKVSEAQKKVQKKVHADPEYRKKISEAAKNRPRIKIKLPDGTIIEITKNNLVRYYINKGKKFEYVS